MFKGPTAPVFRVVDFSLKTEAAGSSKTFVPVFHTMCCHIPEDDILNTFVF
jgi:hypothetical protein